MGDRAAGLLHTALDTLKRVISQGDMKIALKAAGTFNVAADRVRFGRISSASEEVVYKRKSHKKATPIPPGPGTVLTKPSFIPKPARARGAKLHLHMIHIDRKTAGWWRGLCAIRFLTLHRCLGMGRDGLDSDDHNKPSFKKVRV